MQNGDADEMIGDGWAARRDESLTREEHVGQDSGGVVLSGAREVS